jgi:hypothetical protein
MIRAICLSLVVLLAAPVASQPQLPGSDDPRFAWDILTSVTFEEFETDTTWRVEKSFPDGYEEETEGFAISGWAVIYEAQAEIREILLVPQAEDCPFCSGGGETYGPTLEVIFAEPQGIAVPENRITVEGRLVAVTDTDTLQSFRLVDARITDQTEG